MVWTDQSWSRGQSFSDIWYIYILTSLQACSKKCSFTNSTLFFSINPVATTKPNEKQTSMRIFVKALTGRSIPIEIEGSDFVDLLKHKVLDREGIFPAKQNLAYIGQVLQDRLILNDNNI